jgi:phosphoglycerol transferase MdoB-like AlkP superfamily enzyme
MMAFDFTRKLVPPHRLGSANGIANIGGFLATFVTMFLVGLLLDFALRSGWTDGLYSLDGFRLALPIQFAVIAVGVIGFLVERKKAKSRYGNNAGL